MSSKSELAQAAADLDEELSAARKRVAELEAERDAFAVVLRRVERAGRSASESATPPKVAEVEDSELPASQQIGLRFFHDIAPASAGIQELLKGVSNKEVWSYGKSRVVLESLIAAGLVEKKKHGQYGLTVAGVSSGNVLDFRTGSADREEA